ncbi:hypothetical protein DPX39_100065800 [Trypanosoma brucei equiperdum]|uniref:Uncharacterized protein n=1 Tax=Trypanosoma brucei equiperdum TaxID=630700 RepID=A0A3L6KX67_9TRYP|nr:hypothetical protein DPX39_100065800 [Trypanosoma brucei equiperdum]
MVASSTAATAVKNPERWNEAFEELWENILKKKDQIVLSHEPNSPLNSNLLKARLMVCVRTLPRLGVIKRALRQLNANSRATAVEGQGNIDCVPSPQFCKTLDLQWSTTTIWAVESTNEGRVIVIDALTGAVVMVITDPKRGVLISSLMHAPFKGLINRQLEVIPIDSPKQLLHVRESLLINTDYMWIGFGDGSIRLFPASAQRVCESDRSAMMAKGEIADIVFELPKYHKGAIVAIARSPCHEDDKVTDVAMESRLSAAVHELTAATSQLGGEGREHLSLVCTASEDSCIAVWDLKKIYGCIEEMRVICRARSSGMKDYNSWTTSFRADAVTFSVNSPSGGSPGNILSTCTMVKVRPLFKLKGGVGGLRTLKWISTVVTTRNYTKPRDVVAMTRDPKEATASKLIKSRRAFQDMTRWERREEHRFMLRLSEREMRDVERELEILMPPLALEPVQSKRVNLIFSGDVHGTVHLWDLDEELESCLANDVSDPYPHPVRYSPTTSALDGFADSSRFTPNLSLGNRSNSNERTNRSLTPQGNDSFCTPLSPRQRVNTPRSVAGRLSTKTNRSSGLNTGGRAGRLSTRTSASTPRLAVREQSQGIGVISQVSARGVSRVTKTPAQKQQLSSLCFTTTSCSTRKNGVATSKGSDACQPHKSTSRRGTPVSTIKKQRKVSPPSTARFGASVFDGLRGSLCSTPRTAATQWTSQTTGKKVAKAVGKVKRSKAPWDPFTSSTRDRRDVPGGGVASPNGGTTARTRSAKTKKRKASRTHRTATGKVATVLTESTEHDVSDFYRTPSAGRRSYLPTYSVGARYVEQVSAQSYVNTCRSPSRREERGRTSGAADHRQINDLYARKAKFTKDLIDGGTVTGIVVDLPPVITVTMRLLPDPPELHYSLLEHPTPEEVRRRALANTFDELTNNRALYCVFNNLRFYVSVEGVVMNMQCAPKLRKGKGGSSSPGQSPRRDPFQRTDDITFSIVFQRRIIERHSQPVVLLFNDQMKSQLWIARNDGLLSVFSTMTDKVITRVPHPSADTALGPPSLVDWKRQQVGSLLSNGRVVHLEMHRECKKYPLAHFVNFAPLSVLQQFAILKVSRICFDANDIKANRSSLFCRPYCGTSIVKLDARKTLDAHAKSRENNFSSLLLTLMQCRENAVSVRTAQRDLYNSLYCGISDRVGMLITRYSTINAFNAAENAFRVWRLHCKYFRREHMLRNIKRKNFNSLSRMASVMLNAHITNVRRMWLNRWIWATYDRVMQRGRVKLVRTLRIEERAHLKVKVLSFTTSFYCLRKYWQRWRNVIAAAPPESGVMSPAAKVPPTFNASPTIPTLSPRVARYVTHRPAPRTRGAARRIMFQDLSSIVNHIYSCRYKLINFRFTETAENLLDMDELWVDAIEAATGEVELRTAYNLKLAVFKMTFLPLLDGLLSTAEEVLPYIDEASLSMEVRSMLKGCLLCVDYIYADADAVGGRDVDENSTCELMTPEKTQQGNAETNGGTHEERGLRAMFDEVMDDRECYSQVEKIVTRRATLEEFLRLCRFD